MPIVDITNLINLNEGSINLNKNPILIKKGEYDLRSHF